MAKRVQHVSKNRLLEEMRSETATGHCPFCDEPLKPCGPTAKKKFKLICRSEECVRAYHRAYGVQRRAAKGMVPRAEK